MQFGIVLAGSPNGPAEVLEEHLEVGSYLVWMDSCYKANDLGEVDKVHVSLGSSRLQKELDCQFGAGLSEVAYLRVVLDQLCHTEQGVVDLGLLLGIDGVEDLGHNKQRVTELHELREDRQETVASQFYLWVAFSNLLNSPANEVGLQDLLSDHHRSSFYDFL